MQKLNIDSTCRSGDLWPHFKVSPERGAFLHSFIKDFYKRKEAEFKKMVEATIDEAIKNDKDSCDHTIFLNPTECLDSLIGVINSQEELVPCSMLIAHAMEVTRESVTRHADAYPRYAIARKNAKEAAGGNKFATALIDLLDTLAKD